MGALLVPESNDLTRYSDPGQPPRKANIKTHSEKLGSSEAYIGIFVLDTPGRAQAEKARQSRIRDIRGRLIRGGGLQMANGGTNNPRTAACGMVFAAAGYYSPIGNRS